MRILEDVEEGKQVIYEEDEQNRRGNRALRYP